VAWNVNGGDAAPFPPVAIALGSTQATSATTISATPADTRAHRFNRVSSMLPIPARQRLAGRPT